jgi:hypothetical protein
MKLLAAVALTLVSMCAHKVMRRTRRAQPLGCTMPITPTRCKIFVPHDIESCEEIDGHSLPVSALIYACMLELIASRMQSVISTMS